MKEYTPVLSHQIARFGAMTISQMIWLCQGYCRKSTLYRTVGQFVERGLVKRISHPTKPIIAYAATKKLYPLVYGEEHKRRIGVRDVELAHSIACAEAFFELSRYESVIGLASEYEIETSEVRSFCHGRVPDGIVQIRNGSLCYELAVEVEVSNKSEAETNSVLSCYRQTLVRKMPCAGVIIVAGTQEILERYQRVSAVLPSDVEERVLVVDFEGLRNLNPAYFGKRSEGPGVALERVRNSSQGVGTYISTKSKDSVPNRTMESGQISGAGQEIY